MYRSSVCNTWRILVSFFPAFMNWLSIALWKQRCLNMLEVKFYGYSPSTQPQQKFARHIIHDDCRTYCVVSSNSIISASPSSPLSVTSDQNFSNLFFHNETGLLFRWSGIIMSPLLKGLNSNLHHRTQIIMYSVFLALVILTVSAKHSGCLIIKLSKKLSLLI